MNGAGFRQAMGFVHSWGGLIAGWIGFAIFLTGSLAVFDDEITRWSSPELVVAQRATDRQIIATMEHLDRISPDYWFISMPTDRTPRMRVMWKDAGGTIQRAQADASSGRQVTPRVTGGGSFFTKFHYTLHGGDIGTWIVAFASVAMLLVIVTGVIVHRRIFSDFFTFRPRASAQRRWLDLHNLIAVLCLPFLLMIVYTGLTIKSQTYLPVPNGPRPTQPARPLLPPPAPHAAAPDLATFHTRAEQVLGVGRIAFVTNSETDGARRFVASRAIDDRLNLSTDTATFDRASGALLGQTSVDRPAYLTQRVFAGLHFGQYGGIFVRWLYFVLGLAGAVMIATGLVLFTIKRPNRAMAVISIAAVAGLVFVCVVHLAASRWLPPTLADREGVEAWLFFGGWAAAMLHAACRPVLAAWREQAFAAAMLAAILTITDLVAGAAGAAALDGARLAVIAGLFVTAAVLATIGRRFAAMVRDRPIVRTNARQATAA